MMSMSIRILQTILLAAALAIGLMNPVFNGLSLLALAMIAAAGYIPYRIAAREAAFVEALAAETAEAA